MTTNAYDRSVVIAAEPDVVVSYVAAVPELPRWTTFFTHVGALRDGRYEVDTLLGPARTWIERSVAGHQEKCVIWSSFGERLERADVVATPDAGGTNVTFTIRLPRSLSPSRVDAQLGVLAGELARLKAHLERAGAR